MIALLESVKTALLPLLPEGMTLLEDGRGGLIVWQFRGDTDGKVKHLTEEQTAAIRLDAYWKFGEANQ